MNYVRNSTGTTTIKGIYGNIRIELSTDNGSTYSNLISSYNCGAFDENNPERLVNIPINIPNASSSQCYLRFTSLDTTGMTWLSRRFSIVSPAGIAMMLTQMKKSRRRRRYLF